MIELDMVLFVVMCVMGVIGLLCVLGIAVYISIDSQNETNFQLSQEVTEFKKSAREMRKEINLLNKENNQLKLQNNYKIVKEDKEL